MGKKAKRRQRATMNQMNQMVQDQITDFQGRRQEAQGAVDAQRAEFEAFQFTNPFADAQNAFGGIQTQFGNIYSGAQNVYAGAQNQFAGMENLYEGMENRFEDMTVDMRAADFQAQQGQQQRANIMQGLRGAAGTSGIAGLAQAMAGQGALQSQQIAAGISQQERQNQMLAAQEGARIDQLQRGTGMQLQQLEATGAMQTQQMQMAGASEQQRMILGGRAQAQQLGVSQANVQAQGQWAAEMAQMEGAAAVQAAQFGRESTLLGLDYGMLAGANAAEQQAIANQMSSMGMTASMHGSQAANNPFSQILSAGAQVAGKYLAKCIPKGINIDCVDSVKPIEDIKPGDIVIGYNGSPVKVLQKHEYLEDPTSKRFYKVKFEGENGKIHEVNVCDMHKIKGERAINITENVISKEIYNGVEFSYDLLTEDLGYRIDGIPVNSMIEELAELIVKLKNK